MQMSMIIFIWYLSLQTMDNWQDGTLKKKHMCAKKKSSSVFYRHWNKTIKDSLLRWSQMWSKLLDTFSTGWHKHWYTSITRLVSFIRILNWTTFCLIAQVAMLNFQISLFQGVKSIKIQSCSIAREPQVLQPQSAQLWIKMVISQDQPIFGHTESVSTHSLLESSHFTVIVNYKYKLTQDKKSLNVHLNFQMN